jgi:hypothetical protein
MFIKQHLFYNINNDNNIFGDQRKVSLYCAECRPGTPSPADNPSRVRLGLESEDASRRSPAPRRRGTGNIESLSLFFSPALPAVARPGAVPVT